MAESSRGQPTASKANPMPYIKRKSDRPPWLGPARKPFANSRKDVYNTRRWRALAAWHKANNPVCVNFDTCGGAAEITDHVHPLSQGGSPFAVDNLQSLCRMCSASKTSREGHAARRGGG